MADQTTSRNYNIDETKASAMHNRYKRVKCNILGNASGIRETESFWLPIKELRELLAVDDISGVRFYLSAYENGIETDDDPKNRMALTAFTTTEVNADADNDYEKHKSNMDILGSQKSTQLRSNSSGLIAGPFPPPPAANP